MLEQDRIEYCFSLTHELPDVEFKGPAKLGEMPHFARVVRGAMAMANRRNGGIIIIGVAEEETNLCLEGLSPEQLATWKYEYIANGFNSYTNVPIEFDRVEHIHNGNTFLILNIHEFASIPVMCMREYLNPKFPKDPRKAILRPGVFYIRTLNKPESKAVDSSEEIRSLFELANEIAIQSFVKLTRSAGIHIAPEPDDKELFAQQVEGWTGPILKEIRSRGYWDIHIRPVTFQEERLPLSRLREVLMRSSVNYRSWEFPYVTLQRPEIDINWIGLECQKRHGLQSWRFFQSGHFVAAAGFLDDWEDKSTHDLPKDWKLGTSLSILDVVYRLTEIYGLASRLATTEVYREERSVVVDFTLYGLQGRTLNNRGRLFFVPDQPARVETIHYPNMTLKKEDVIAHPQTLAIKAAHYIFERFGWEPSYPLLTTIQDELGINL